MGGPKDAAEHRSSTAGHHRIVLDDQFVDLRQEGARELAAARHPDTQRAVLGLELPDRRVRAGDEAVDGDADEVGEVPHGVLTGALRIGGVP